MTNQEAGAWETCRIGSCHRHEKCMYTPCRSREAGAARRRPSPEERFWPKVDRRGHDECWPWLAGCDRRGYGLFSVAGIYRRATWFALELTGKPRPSDKHLACHTCDNPPCVNPRHLWWGTKSENALDSSAKGRHPKVRKTHCPAGHPFAGDNLFIDNAGSRNCRICRQAQWLRSYHKRRSQRGAR